MSHKNQRFRPHQRLKLSRDFDRVFAARCSAGSDLLVVYVDSNGLPYSRLGIVTGKSVGPAVRRNYAKRRLREAFRRNQDAIPTGFDYVCVLKPPAADRARDLTFALIDQTVRATRRFLQRSKERKA